MVLIVLMLITGVSVLVFVLTSSARFTLRSDKVTSDALAEARDALIGRAASDDNRPGSLPCPDLVTNIVGTNVPNDGNADLLVGNECPSYVGRLPWRTLGLPDLRDGSGERLWYAVSRTFRDDTSAQPINSDTAGLYTVTIGSNTSTGVIAVIFAPGAILGTQDRSTATENAVANYLEGGNEVNGTITFTTQTATSTFNDKLLPLTRDTLFPVVEMRVAREVRSLLRTYYTTNRYYPNPALFPNYSSTSNNYRGHVPTSTCAPVVTPAWPAWFTDNNWHQYMVYSVAPRCTPRVTNTILSLGAAPPCAVLCLGPIFGLYSCVMPNAIDATMLNCGNLTTPAGAAYLTVSGVTAASIESIVMPASYRLGTQARPCNSISDCLETVGGNNENIDGVDNYAYVKPLRSSANNDNVVVVRP
jgi:hypothetical protein